MEREYEVEREEREEKVDWVKGEDRRGKKMKRNGGTKQWDEVRKREVKKENRECGGKKGC